MRRTQRGQSLVILLVFMAVALTITGATATLIAVNSQTTSAFNEGQSAFEVAESGVENALLRLLRDPSYPGETLQVGLGSAIVIVNNNVITSLGRWGGTTRKIQVSVSFNAGRMTIDSWREVID